MLGRLLNNRIDALKHSLEVLIILKEISSGVVGVTMILILLQALLIGMFSLFQFISL